MNRHFLTSSKIGELTGKDKLKRKDLLLAEDIRQGNDTPSSDINAYRLTKKRLKNQLEKFALLYNTNHNKISKINNMIEMAKYLSAKNLYLHAWDYLHKAEQQALELEEYGLLDAIYYLQISYYSNRYLTDNILHLGIKDLLKKQEANAHLAQIDTNGNSAFSLLTYELSKHLSTGFHDNQDILVNKILKKYNLENKLYTSHKIYSRIINIVCWALVENKKYTALKKFALKSYGEITKRKLLDKVPKDFLMEFLSILCLSLIRTKDYVKLEKFQKIYEQRVDLFKMERDKYITHHFRNGLMAADLYMCTGRLPEAKQRLLELNKTYKDYTQSLTTFFILRVNMMTMYFNEENYSSCIKLFVETTQHNHFKKIINEPGLGIEIVFLTEIYAVIFYYEEQDFDYANHLLKGIRRRYNYILNQKERKREVLICNILESMTNEPLYTKSSRFKTQYNKFISMQKFIPSDKEYISLNAWLTSKYSGNPYYQCYLNYTL